jgi:Ni/Co efflux regulator RcnB
MRKILLLSAGLLALLAAPAMAQQRGEHGHGGGRGAPAAQSAPAPQAAPANRAEAGRQSMQRQQAQRPQFDNRDRGQFTQRNGNDRRDFGRQDNNRPQFNRGNNDRRDFGRNDNRGFRNDNHFDNRFGNRNWSQYRRAFSAPQRFHYRGPAYYRPSGWYYRRWTYGDFLPSLFWGSNYWIDDFGYYDLMPPPPGTVWVRYGNDALLIDRYTGEVIQVEYGIFF